jgi:predicted metal-dependent peptidase
MKGLPTNLMQARLLACKYWPYFATAIWRVEMHEASGPMPGPMGIDQRWRVFYNAEECAKMESPQLAFILCHEINHCLREHSHRMQERNSMLWNIAGDLEINDDLSEKGLSSDSFVPVFPHTFGFQSNLTAEAYYDLLMKNAKKGTSKCECGPGANGPPESGDGPSKEGDREGVSEAEANLIRHEVARAAKAAGKLPAGMEQWVEDTLDPKVDWHTLLARYLSRAGHVVSGCVDYSYSKPSRRAWYPIILPKMIARRARLAIVMDTSGSMYGGPLSTAFTEVKGIARAGNMDSTVYFVDAEVASTGRAGDSGLASKVSGGGGTDMGVGIEAALAAHPKPDVIVVVTDGETPWPDYAPPIPVIVAIVHDNPYFSSSPPPSWAQVVHVK